MPVKVIRAKKRAAPNSPVKPDKTLTRPIPPGQRAHAYNAITRGEADAIICHAIKAMKEVALWTCRSNGADDLITLKCETAAQDLTSLRRYLAQALGG